METFEIPGRLPGMNEIITAAKSHYGKYSSMKKKYTKLVVDSCRKIGPHNSVYLEITWYVPNLKRDPDNIAAGVKFIFDGLVDAGVIPKDTIAYNRGWKNDDFILDRDNPRVVVKIFERGKPLDLKKYGKKSKKKKKKKKRVWF